MDWDQLYTNVKKIANRAADKVGQTADLATLQVKLSLANKDLEKAYAALGHVSYEHFTGDEDHSEQVAQAVSNINDAIIAVRNLEAQIELAKRRSETASAQKAEASAQKTGASAPKATAEKPVQASTGATKAATSPTLSLSHDSVEIEVDEEA